MALAAISWFQSRAQRLSDYQAAQPAYQAPSFDPTSRLAACGSGLRLGWFFFSGAAADAQGVGPLDGLDDSAENGHDR